MLHIGGTVLCAVAGLGRLFVVSVVRSACGDRCGVMSIFHRRGPVVSHVPRRMGMPWASVIVRPVFVKVAVQSASHSLPMLMRLLVKPGTTWPVRACIEGRECRASCAMVAEVCGAPAAVRMVMRCPAGLTVVTGAVVVK